MSEIELPELELLQKSLSHFRDLINQSRRHYSLFQRPKDFNYVCSAMDIIGDVIYGFYSYIRQSHQDQGLAYLEIFGVLQGLNIQQDAVRQLHKIIVGGDLNLEDVSPDIKKIRDIRVKVAGHPVTGSGGSHFLVRYTVSKWGFELWSYRDGSGRTSEKVNLPDLIKKNTLILNAEINKIIAFINAEDNKHKEAFMQESLAKLFSNSGYQSGKLFEGIPDYNPMSKIALSTIREAIANFKESLKARSPHFDEKYYVSHDIPILEHALTKYEESCQGASKSYNDAYIAASFIRSMLDHLHTIAQEIDEEYQTAS